ncbi:MAG TPA: NAD(P)/FAD-dependent oxidoreductase [Chloroflexota bacterium]
MAVMAENSRETQPHVVIIGGGFGGLHAAQSLGSKAVRVTLVDRRNHHLFQPLLYQVATATLSPGDVAEPLRQIVRRHRNVRTLLAEVTAIDLEGKTITLAEGDQLQYDYLILAAGGRHAYFGHDAWEPLAPGLKTLEDALEIRRRILSAFERAERLCLEARDSGEQVPGDVIKALLTFAIIGGGPTGIELAGALTEIAQHTLAGEFQGIDPRQARIIVLEGESRVLPAMPAKLSHKAETALKRLGVEVRTHSLVTDVTEDGISVGEEFIPVKTVFWAAGVAAAPLARTLGVPLDRAGRVPVEPDLTLAGHPEVYVIGDLSTESKPTGPLPGLAAVAMQEGRAAAENLLRSEQGIARLRFRYRDRGAMAIIGRGSAVAAFPHGVQIAGPVAWLAWLFIHLYMLIGFENRVLVLMQWAWSYLTWNRGARLITETSISEAIEASARARGRPRGRTSA